MDAIILAAGYATRLYPLTENPPKPLLKAAGKAIIEHILGKIAELGGIKKIYIVTNNKFAANFEEWAKNFESDFIVKIINDGTESNEDRLGAIGDMQHVIEKNSIDDDTIVIAGDNLFEFHLNGPMSLFRKKKSDVIVLYDVKDFELAKHYGVVEVKGGLLEKFEEKPAHPSSTLVSTGVYLFTRKTASLIKKYLEQGNNPDKSGSFVEWLHKREKVYAYITDKRWYDIGSFEQLEKADREFRG
ncbi:MAG: Nucleotidyl transferase [Candidatus Nomurabacteria bacterium GW2011_GWA2_40_9]|uniref:Nucleotidyl transferase n=1 Tax=Candidatus Nomurabacteria bacterium GW2011_GWA2_40_9 TaxID=1618734 RepID=A0A0G0TWC6_9BACT|nr:MAG: Nucleotidyl transferase [Candidatus Nomurabacteria bacterium GW2011_GWA2_40_9]